MIAISQTIILFLSVSSFYTIQEYDFQNDDKNLKDKKNKIYESTFSKVTLSLSKKKKSYKH